MPGQAGKLLDLMVPSCPGERVTCVAQDVQFLTVAGEVGGDRGDRREQQKGVCSVLWGLVDIGSGGQDPSHLGNAGRDDPRGALALSKSCVQQRCS